MAFVHCHSCHWEQDDFWSVRGYNPLRFFVTNELRWYWRPRLVNVDAPMGHGQIPYYLHSWYLLIRSVRKLVRRLRTQHWWTYESWKRAIKANDGKWPPCPKCGSHLCID